VSAEAVRPIKNNPTAVIEKVRVIISSVYDSLLKLIQANDRSCGRTVVGGFARRYFEGGV
jgi:hypothetical protein